MPHVVWAAAHDIPLVNCRLWHNLYNAMHTQLRSYKHASSGASSTADCLGRGLERAGRWPPPPHFLGAHIRDEPLGCTAHTPQVIEMTQVTPASDIWSVGCLIIEMLTGSPPYYDLQPMSALFRIVQVRFEGMHYWGMMASLALTWLHASSQHRRRVAQN
jgi:hypothetical protein